MTEVSRRAYPKAEEFKTRWDRLETHVAKYAPGPFGPAERQKALKRAVHEAAVSYDRARCSADTASRSTFHVLGKLLPPVIKALKNKVDRESLLLALGAPASNAGMTWPVCDREAVERARARYESMLLALEQIARAAPPPPMAVLGKPSGTKDLRAAVEVLVEFWERQPGGRFRGEFIRRAMELIDPERLGELPDVIEVIVAARRASTDK
jgi:hypothetical protein